MFPWKRNRASTLIVVERTGVVKLCRPRDPRKIKLLGRLRYCRDLRSSSERIIPIDLEPGLFGIGPRDFLQRTEDRAHFLYVLSVSLQPFRRTIQRGAEQGRWSCSGEIQIEYIPNV